MANPKTKDVVLKTLSPKNITNFNVRGTQYIVDVAPDTDIKDMLEPKYWTHVAGTVFMGDIVIIHVYWQDMSQYAELLVTDYEHAYAVAKVLKHVDFRTEEPTLVEDSEPKFKRDWTGHEHKFNIIRISDGEIMLRGIKTKDQCIEEIAKLEKAHK